jgi:hypothetical protein
MSRDLDIESGGFPIYEDKNLPKVNAWRRAASMVGRKDVLPDRASVLFSTAESAHDEPRSCFNCPFYKEQAGRCVLHASNVKIYKFTVGGKDGNPIDYWPVCGYWIYGDPGDVQRHLADLNPEDTGLAWINAPETGLRRSGSCCGGQNGGDDCDYFDTAGGVAKWDATTGMCRVLKQTVTNMDCCNFWTDDDLLPWTTAQVWLKDKP